MELIGLQITKIIGGKIMEANIQKTMTNIKRKRNSTKRDLPKTHSLSVRLDDIAYKALSEKKKMTGNNTSEIINDLLKNKRLRPYKKIREIAKQVADIDSCINRLSTEVKSERIKNELTDSRIELEQCKQDLDDLLK